MGAQDITTAISTLGFPICMCAALFWYMIKQNELHQTESKEMRDCIDKLENAITKLTERLSKDGGN